MGSATTNDSNSNPSSSNEKAFVKYDLYRGHPNDHALPTSEIQSIMTSLLHNDHKDSLVSSLGYGPNAGNDELLTALHSFLGRRTGNDVTEVKAATTTIESDFFITNGVSHGIELLCATCTNPGQEVWIERPTYFLVPKIFTSHGLVIKPLPMISDRDGDYCQVEIGQIDVNRLIGLVDVDGVPPPKMIFVIPSYHNPTGRSMTVENRAKLAAFAIRNNILLVADEVYHLLDWERDQDGDYHTPRPAAITRFNKHMNSSDTDSKGCCISVSSFTKIFAPGVRVGWIEAPSYIIERLTSYAYINSQGGVAPFMGRLMTHAIETGLLDRYLDKLVLEYSERFSLICGILEKEPRIKVLTKHTTSGRQGGYFIWIQFPSDVDSEEFASYSLKEHGVRFMAGKSSDPFHHDNNTKVAISSCARLCFADLDREKLEQGAVAFIEAFQSFVDANQSSHC